ncbi:type IV pilus assembly protein FimV [Elongatibacter sediminis]|uniref:FimV/HubP family polar landmark protein n=1 Tax=Elongatibacter sediminis TaxID=3119006 RepID=A0AAW9RAD2_9GAMM
MTISLGKVARWTLCAGLALFSPAVLALGLGNASVESFLDQPLRARIDLISRPDEDLGSVSAGLASADDFALIGASREAISVPLRFTLQQEGDDAWIVVTSNLAVRDPIIRLIVEVTWPGGRMLREYTLFLDPPTVPSAAPPPPSAPAREAMPDDSGRAAPEPVSAAESPAVSASGPAAAAIPEEGEYGPVRPGETLWRIASDWSAGTGMDLNQVMLAIQRNNPQAFINDNINLLKRGAILRMPRRQDIETLSPSAARDEVLEQASEFGAGLDTVSSAAVDTPLIADTSVAPDVGVAEEEPVAEAQLEIVPPSESEGVDSAYGTADDAAEDAEASTSATVLREELARTEEELFSEQQENEFLRERIEELESRLTETGEEATVEDAELAAMEARLRDERLGQAAGLDEPPASDSAAAAPPRAADAVPQVRTTDGPREESSWYQSRTAVWVILLVVAAIVAGWFVSRRGRAEPVIAGAAGADDGTVRDIQDEAEEILRVLHPDEAEADSGETGPVEDEDDSLADEAAGGDADEESPRKAARQPDRDEDEAELLDEDSEDPEVRLDLARAYISMGDKEAARVILAEVIEHGDEEQQAEARTMISEL